MFIFVYSLFCLNIAINSMGIVCDDRTFYGSIIRRKDDKISTANYKIKKRIFRSTKRNSLTLDYKHCTTTNLTKCWEGIEQAKSLRDIPKDNIFIKIFYWTEFHTKLPIEVKQRLRESDTIFAKQFVNIKNAAPIEYYTSRNRDIYWWAFENIDIENEILKNYTTIILTKTRLFISFLTSPQNNFPNKMIYEVKYHATKYTVAANTYACGSLLEVTYLIYEYLIKNSDISRDIEHPCMPTNSFSSFNPSNVRYWCATDFGVNTPVRFIGAFNETKCYSLIKMALVLTAYESNNQIIHNFAGIHFPLLTNSNNKLKIKSKLFGKNKVLNKQSLFKIKTKACDPLKKPQAILLTGNKCFQAVYLECLIYNIVGFRGDNWLHKNKFEDAEPFHINIFADPRFGFTFTNKTESTKSTESTDSLSTSKISGASNRHLLNLILNTVAVVILLIGLLSIYFTRHASNKDGV